LINRKNATDTDPGRFGIRTEKTRRGRLLRETDGRKYYRPGRDSINNLKKNEMPIHPCNIESSNHKKFFLLQKNLLPYRCYRQTRLAHRTMSVNQKPRGRENQQDSIDLNLNLQVVGVAPD